MTYFGMCQAGPTTDQDIASLAAQMGVQGFTAFRQNAPPPVPNQTDLDHYNGVGLPEPLHTYRNTMNMNSLKLPINFATAHVVSVTTAGTVATWIVDTTVGFAVNDYILSTGVSVSGYNLIPGATGPPAKYWETSLVDGSFTNPRWKILSVNPGTNTITSTMTAGLAPGTGGQFVNSGWRGVANGLADQDFKNWAAAINAGPFTALKPFLFAWCHEQITNNASQCAIDGNGTAADFAAAFAHAANIPEFKALRPSIIPINNSGGTVSNPGGSGKMLFCWVPSMPQVLDDPSYVLHGWETGSGPSRTPGGANPHDGVTVCDPGAANYDMFGVDHYEESASGVAKPLHPVLDAVGNWARDHGKQYVIGEWGVDQAVSSPMSSANQVAYWQESANQIIAQGTSGPGSCLAWCTATDTFFDAGVINFVKTVMAPNSQFSFAGGVSPFIATVKFNGVVASFTLVDDSHINTVVPATATTGPITVTTSGGIATSGIFTVDVVPTTPIIDFLFPDSGSFGDFIAIQGSHLLNPTAVRFNGINSSLFTTNDDAQITAQVPIGATDGPVSVTTAAGTASSPTNFTIDVIPPPPPPPDPNFLFWDNSLDIWDNPNDTWDGVPSGLPPLGDVVDTTIIIQIYIPKYELINIYTPLSVKSEYGVITIICIYKSVRISSAYDAINVRSVYSPDFRVEGRP